MTCDAVQNRLLALPDPAMPPDVLRTHLAACPACRRVHAEVVRIERLVAGLPAPSAEARKLAFLAALQPAPVVVPRRSSAKMRPYRKPVPPGRTRWGYVAALAAGVLLAVGGVWLFTRPHAGQAESAEKPRHDLLTNSVKHTVRLANADSPPGRLSVWTDWSAEFRAETREVYKVAEADEMNALARGFDRAVREGMLAQADQLPRHMDAAERRKLLDAADAQMKLAQQDATELAAEAPPAAQKPLQRIAATATTARTKLAALKQGLPALKQGGA